jgi:hypothetical protein
VHSLQSHGHDGSHSWLPHRAGRIDAADEWARSPLAVCRVSRGLDGEEVEALSTPRMTLGVDLKWLFQFLVWYK